MHSVLARFLLLAKKKKKNGAMNLDVHHPRQFSFQVW